MGAVSVGGGPKVLLYGGAGCGVILGILDVVIGNAPMGVLELIAVAAFGASLMVPRVQDAAALLRKSSRVEVPKKEKETGPEPKKKAGKKKDWDIR
jgi:hypothetical protein